MKRKSIILILIISILFIGVSVDAKALILASASCSGYFGSPSDEGSLMHLLVGIFNLIKIAVPIILLAMTTVDFSMVVFSDSKDGMEKAKKNFTKRAIIAVIIFFIPVLLEIILNYANDASIKACLNNFK